MACSVLLGSTCKTPFSRLQAEGEFSFLIVSIFQKFLRDPEHLVQLAHLLILSPDPALLLWINRNTKDTKMHLITRRSAELESRQAASCKRSVVLVACSCSMRSLVAQPRALHIWRDCVCRKRFVRARLSNYLSDLGPALSHT